MKKRKTLAKLQAQCDAWNARYPIGTPVKLYKLMNPSEELIGTFNTKTAAEVLSGHTAVLWLMSYSGCVALDACEPVEVRLEKPEVPR